MKQDFQDTGLDKATLMKKQDNRHIDSIKMPSLEVDINVI